MKCEPKGLLSFRRGERGLKTGTILHGFDQNHRLCLGETLIRISIDTIRRVSPDGHTSLACFIQVESLVSRPCSRGVIRDILVWMVFPVFPASCEVEMLPFYSHESGVPTRPVCSKPTARDTRFIFCPTIKRAVVQATGSDLRPIKSAALDAYRFSASMP